MKFNDHFSLHSSSYASFRPKSPEKLFAYLASLASKRALAWDVGTGNGQAALGLAPYFEKIIATDGSAEQLKQAVSHPKISYQVALAEQSPLKSASVDLITCAQSVHWFQLEKFYSEVRRVAAPEAVLGVWTYDRGLIDPLVDALVDAYASRIARFWPPERRLVDTHYQTLPFPFAEIPSPTFQIIEKRNLAQWLGYLFTWSATQRAIKDLGREVYDNLAENLKNTWGDPEEKKEVRWPLFLRVGYVFQNEK